MLTTLNGEELFVLNSILFYLPNNTAFIVSAIHAEHILKPLYPNGTGGVDLKQYDAVRNEYQNKNVYQHIYPDVVANALMIRLIIKLL